MSTVAAGPTKEGAVATEWGRFWRDVGVLVLVALGVGVLVTVIGVSAYLGSVGDQSGWETLGAYALALFLMPGAGILTLAVGAVVLVRRFAPPGRRLPVLGWVLPLLVAAAVSLLWVAEGGWALFVPVALVLLAVAVALVLVAVREGARLRATPWQGRRRRSVSRSA